MGKFPVSFSQLTRELTYAFKTVKYTACTIAFEDTLLTLLSNDGKIAQMIAVAFTSSTAVASSVPYDTEFSMLPDPDMTPTWILGSSDSLRSDIAGLLSVQITSAIKQDGSDGRKLILGFSFAGLDDVWHAKNGFVEEDSQALLVQLVALATDTYRKSLSDAASEVS